MKQAVSLPVKQEKRSGGCLKYLMEILKVREDFPEIITCMRFVCSFKLLQFSLCLTEAFLDVCKKV